MVNQDHLVPTQVFVFHLFHSGD